MPFSIAAPTQNFVCVRIWANLIEFRGTQREETVSPQLDHSDQNYVRIAVRSCAMPLDFRLVWITVVWDFYLELVAYAESGLDQGEFRN